MLTIVAIYIDRNIQANIVGRDGSLDNASARLKNFTEFKQGLADKHRNIIGGGSQKRMQKGDNSASAIVFGMQLYKDVDSDHQQKMLNSNIYIPDDSETRHIDDERHDRSLEIEPVYIASDKANTRSTNDDATLYQ